MHTKTEKKKYAKHARVFVVLFLNEQTSKIEYFVTTLVFLNQRKPDTMDEIDSCDQNQGSVFLFI